MRLFEREPFRQSRPDLAALYREILLYSPYLDIVTLEASIAESAARIRARHGIRTPDAIQIATALGAGCQAFLTNDAIEGVGNFAVPPGLSAAQALASAVSGRAALA